MIGELLHLAGRLTLRLTEFKEEGSARPHEERDERADRMRRSQGRRNPGADRICNDQSGGHHYREADNKLLFG